MGPRQHWGDCRGEGGFVWAAGEQPLRKAFMRGRSMNRNVKKKRELVTAVDEMFSRSKKEPEGEGSCSVRNRRRTHVVGQMRPEDASQPFRNWNPGPLAPTWHTINDKVGEGAGSKQSYNVGPANAQVSPLKTEGVDEHRVTRAYRRNCSYP